MRRIESIKRPISSAERDSIDTDTSPWASRSATRTASAIGAVTECTAYQPSTASARIAAALMSSTMSRVRRWSPAASSNAEPIASVSRLRLAWRRPSIAWYCCDMDVIAA